MKYERIPYLVVFDEVSAFKDTYGGQIGKVAIEAHLLRPEVPSDSVVIFSHPIGGGAWLPLVSTLAKRGVHTIYCNTRYRGNDTALIMERAVMDFAACIRDAKERLGYSKVYLGGWSGGGALSMFYQAEAQDPRVTHTPAGDPYDLTAAKFIPADGVLLLAAHLSRNLTLTEWLDPSITDETRPFDRDARLDLYAADGPRPPYSAAFVAEYRAAQIARNRRITAWAKQELAALKVAGLADHERCFTVQGTMADPRFLDPTLDPSDRRPNWCMLGDPKVVNDGPVGLARFTTLRSWLSQWAYDESNADGLKCAARIACPMLVIENSADDACTPSHAARLMDAAVHCTKDHHVIDGANHYYFGQPELAQQAADIVHDWIAAQR
ncbi:MULTISPECIES: alpha/beta hydrolase family protein [Sphingopyxis]|jgi:alpha-beta hydrolase superfamily lysophospholipase|uniref:alpha/beta hydrolase family protein n=1 Tax=Sphingopyxis TaxID=165697 RepID=UPI000832864C|nr:MULTISPECIES: alpha/beta fold hydrolase [Sphingopyxis]ODU26532.1 MAG: alpha/beta hydrolase [Sphingopyxis sp. SCN 67-31]